jgi:NAD(P)-dependent dehydrogenase (short-subunit alcohol dehydrogenase family)
MSKPFAIVTGSSGIGLELAAMCAQEGFDLLVAADRPGTASTTPRRLGDSPLPPRFIDCAETGFL